MEAAAEQVRASSPGERALIRRFSEQEASRIEYPNVVHAVATYGSQEREVEAAKWRAQFDDKLATSNVQLERLGFEAKELQKILQAFPGAGTGKDWGLKDVKETVEEARKTWESKKRVFSGKPQKFYHDVMCNLDAHSGLLCMLPQSNDYVALVAGAIKTIVKASVRHRKNIELLTRSLKEINDEAHACLVDKHLIKSEAVQTAIAKFYVELFLFYGDVIKWYESSSSRKFWHSLQDNFSDRFENALTNLHRLSQLVMRAAVSGQGAELRVTRLAVEDVNEDVRAGLSGIARENAEIRLTQDRIMLGLKHLANPETLQRKNTQLWHQVGLSGTALLLGQKENEDSKKIEAQVAITSGAFQVATKASDQQLSSEYLEDEPSETQFTIYEIGQLMEPLLNILTQGVRVVDTNFPSPMAFDNRVSIALERWTLSQKSTILYLEFSGMSIGRHSPQMTAAACKIVNSAAQLSIPVISFFCNHPTSVPQPADHHTSQPENILGLIYSLAFQLSQIIPPLTKTTLHLSLTQLTALDLSPTSWTLALHVLARLLEHSPPLLLCVIDSFHQLDMSPTSSTHTHELLCVLQNAMKTEGKVFKILFTDSKRGRSLISEIPLESREIIEGERRSGTGRGVGRAPAGRGFIEFGF